MKTQFYQSVRPIKANATWNDVFVALAKLASLFGLLFVLISGESIINYLMTFLN